jgi:hypothetical protein
VAEACDGATHQDYINVAGESRSSKKYFDTDTAETTTTTMADKDKKRKREAGKEERPHKRVALTEVSRPTIKVSHLPAESIGPVIGKFFSRLENCKSM